MKEKGVDCQVLTISASHAFYDREAGFAEALHVAANEDFAHLSKSHPKNFIPAATVPLQEIPRAIKELERAVKKLRHRAVFMPSNVSGRYLDDRAFFPLYEAAQGLDVPLIVHPTTPVGIEKMKGYHLFNLVGFPFDQTLNLARMIFGGVFESFTRLKAFFTHGAGAAPFLRGRWDHGYRVREEAKEHIRRPPSEYLMQCYFGTMVYHPPTLAYLISSLGSDRVCLGSDYPFDMADPDPVGTVRKVEGLSKEDLRRVLGENAEKLLGLST
jgi:aminocarboxymuconate-semialdehyde decarboxylase